MEIKDTNDQTLQRLKKLEEIIGMGIYPYGGRFDARDSAKSLLEQYQNISAELLDKEEGLRSIAGRIIALRRFGKAAFAHIQDYSGRMQVYFKKDLLGNKGFDLFERLDVGDIVGVKGRLFRTKTGELTIQTEVLVLLAKSLRPLPEKWHGLTDIETRYRQRYLDLIANPEKKETFVIRARIINSIREFLNERGFLEVETPMMQSIPGGATARPFVTHHNALGIDLYLRIAPELYLKRLIAGGFERVYEINRNFRNEGISTIHNPEFTMLEFYMAYSDYQCLMEFTEEMITAIAKRVTGGLKFRYGEKEIDLSPPWEKLKFHESIVKFNQLKIEELRDKKKIEAYAKSRGIEVSGNEAIGKLLNEIFETTVEPNLINPTFITDYPTDISPLAKRRADDPELTERFELFIASREIANAFSELNDPQDQRLRFEEQMAQRASGDLEAQRIDEDFIRALEYGMPPAAGEGIGIDRLVMLFTNQSSIRDVILFPQMRPKE